MINIPSLIGFFLANENKLKKIYKSSFKSKTKNKKTNLHFENQMIRSENQAISRLTSSSFGQIYSTVSKFIDK